MRVKELRQLIEGVPDDTVVLVPGREHSYYTPTVRIGQAHYHKTFGYAEDGGEEYESQYGPRVTALIVGG